MAWKSQLIRPFAGRIRRRMDVEGKRAVELQQRTFERLLRLGRDTIFGKDHRFNKIRTPADFAHQVPLRDYELLRPYVDQIIAGKPSVLWPGMPKYFAKTSGTTSGVKYIPITQASIPNHIGSARNALFNYMTQTGNGRFFDGRMIFLSGSPTLGQTGNVLTGRLSGIVNHLVPGWVRSNQLPSYETNCIADWTDKVAAIVRETWDQDMRLISGIPPWVETYYQAILEKTGKSNILEVFPNFSLFVHGGVNYAPYAQRLEELVGRELDTLETYPASEGFIAYQDRWPFEGLWLNVNSGIYFEFVPLEEIYSEQARRLGLVEVELDRDYVVIINSNAGLWGYNIGDTVRFVSLDPPRIVVSGRVKHFISAFGEHVIGKEVEQALVTACAETGLPVTECTVAPQVNPAEGQLPYHEWFVEFGNDVTEIERFAQLLDTSVVEQNIYYKDLITGGILQPLKVTLVRKNGFRDYMDSLGKLGGQNKVPRLLNDRTLADGLRPYLESAGSA